MSDIGQGEIAAEVTKEHWEGCRFKVIDWLCQRGFTPKAAEVAFQNFLETQVLVARVTGELQFNAPPKFMRPWL